MVDESLELSEVQAAFREAERRFNDLSAAAEDLQSVSGQLSDARATVTEAGSRLSELAQASRQVSEQLAEATTAIQATDPAELRSRLQEVADRLDSHVNESSEALSNLSEAHRESQEQNRSQMRLQLILSSLTLLAVIAVGVLVLII